MGRPTCVSSFQAFLSNFLIPFPTRNSIYPATFFKAHANTNWIRTGWKDDILCHCRAFVVLSRAWAEPWGSQGQLENGRGGENGKGPMMNSNTRLTSCDQVVASSALFNHAGDGIVASFHSEHTLRVFDYPALTIQENPAAHVGGCIAIAQDPRGKYIASGGHDSIVNLFDVTEWICARTITCCE